MTGTVPRVPIKIGDVGYIHLGQFFFLFHAGSEQGVNGLQSFEPLAIGEMTFRIPRGPDRFHTDSVREITAAAGATISATPYAPSLRLSLTRLKMSHTDPRNLAHVSHISSLEVTVRRW